jgi:SPX domain protein involved in polyphosphate accumulation
MFKKIFPKRVVNSIYFDTEKYKDVWDNINGFGNRRKIRLRWYNELKNSQVNIEEKNKVGFVTKKYVKSIGTYKDFDDLNNFINSKDFLNNKFFLKKKLNIKKILYIQYHRNYFQLPNNKLRVTVDEKLRIFYEFPNKFIDLDKIIVELKYDVKDSNFVNSFIKSNNLRARNQKFSKYVNSFIEMNECALV